MDSCIHYNHRPHINSISDLTDHLSELSSHALIVYGLVYAVYGYYHLSQLSHVLSLRPYIEYVHVITTGRAFRDGFSTQQPSQSAQCLNGCGFSSKQLLKAGTMNV